MEKKPSFLINVITGRVVTRGQRHRVLVRDDRGVVVGVAEALGLVLRKFSTFFLRRVTVHSEYYSTRSAL